MGKIQEIRDAMNKRFLERSDLVDGMLVALLAKEHLLMLGPPGTAKSLISDTLCSTVSGRFFKWVLGKLSTPEELFGPYSLKGLDEDRYCRAMDGKLPTAVIAFIDEIFKSNSALLNMMLTVLNERTICNDGKEVPIPLVSLFGASNELPQGEELAALYDRFVLRFFVNRLQEDKNAMQLFMGIIREELPKISLSELAAEQAEVQKVVITEELATNLVALRRAVEEEGIFVSDRKWFQTVGILKAYAYLEGAKEVTDDHMDILASVLWNTLEQRKIARRLVGRFSNPLGEQILQYVDAVDELHLNAQKARSSGDKKVDTVEIYNKVKDAEKKLKGLGNPTTNRKLTAAIAHVQNIKKDIAKYDLGLD